MLKFVANIDIEDNKIHRIITFKQNCIIRDYSELNSEMRLYST